MRTMNSRGDYRPLFQCEGIAIVMLCCVMFFQFVRHAKFGEHAFTFRMLLTIVVLLVLAVGHFRLNKISIVLFSALSLAFGVFAFTQIILRIQAPLQLFALGYSLLFVLPLVLAVLGWHSLSNVKNVDGEH